MNNIMDSKEDLIKKIEKLNKRIEELENLEINHRKTEETLKEQAETIRSIIHSSQDWIWSINLQGIHTYSNPAVKSILGYELDELIGKPSLDLMHREDRKMIEKKLPVWISEKQGWKGLVIRFKHKDGSWRYLESSALPIFGPKDEFLGFRGVDRDITERKQILENVKDSEERLKIIFELAPDAIYLMNIKGIFLDGNQAAEELLGYKREELLGKNFLKLNLLSANELVKATKALAKSALGKKTPPEEYLLNRKDGSQVAAEISTYPVKIKGKWVILGIARDITIRKTIDKKLLKEVNFNKTLLKTSPTFIVVIDKNGKTIMINDSFLKALEYKREEIVGKDYMSKLVPKRQHNRVMKIFSSLTKDKLPTWNENFILTKSGKEILVEWHGRPVFDDKDKYDYFFGMGVDITDRKKKEQMLKEALIKAEESDKLKSAFLANMSHEIRTPMNAIMGFSKLLEDADTEETRKEFINIINSNSEHLLRIITDLIDTSKIEAGLIEIENREFNINELLDDITKVFKIKDKIENNKIVIKVNKAYSDAEAIINCDRTRLQQIIINLLENAYKYTFDGEIELGYSLPVVVDNTELIEFFVKDTGEGIDESKQSIIFERFVQEDSSLTRLIGGTGLGLTLAKGFVSILGGNIRVESKPNIGSTFYFSIPYQKGSIEDGLIEASDTEAIDWGDKTILIAEDTDESYIFLKSVLEELNVKIIRAKNGFEAVDICKNEPQIDLVLMDIRMPIMNGYEASAEIKRIKAELPIIAQTAHAMSGDEEKASEAGCDDYISKPINPIQLIEKIKKALP